VTPKGSGSRGEAATSRSSRPSVTATLTSAKRVRPGLVGLSRRVPDGIDRPSYAETGQPPAPLTTHVRSADVIDRMRRAGALAAEVLITVGEAVTPGITTDELDAIGHDAIVAAGAYPSPLNYRNFPSATASPTRAGSTTATS
jgi:methionyl aminopeptidase